MVYALIRVFHPNGMASKQLGKYRGVTYHITVTNPKHVCKGVIKVTVNGKQVEGSLVRTEKKSGEINVEVVMG